VVAKAVHTPAVIAAYKLSVRNSVLN
jgi:hypothetical protein